MSYTAPDRDYLRDILEAAKAIAEYVHGITVAQFQRDRMRRDAVVRNIEVIGEATKRLSALTRDAMSDVPWQKMAGMRDVVIHAYDTIDMEEVWRVATVDIPILVRCLTPVAEGE